MQANQAFGISDQPSGYVPYFYQAGLFQLYNVPIDRADSGADQTLTVPHDRAASAYHVSSIDRMQTVEQIVANGYFAAPQGDAVTAIISDKQQTLWLGLDDVIGQIRQRHEIYERHLYQIELGKCAAMNSLYTAEAYQGPADSKQFYSRHKRLQELYEQERDERVSLWKDVSRLRQTLPESAQAYLGARRRVEALENTTGELP